jgi:ketosteroid isomerase-like protein
MNGGEAGASDLTAAEICDAVRKVVPAAGAEYVPFDCIGGAYCRTVPHRGCATVQDDMDCCRYFSGERMWTQRKRMITRCAVLATALCLTPAIWSQVPAGNDQAAKAEVEQVLHAQQDAWNRHDLDGFMAGYWKSPELTFFSAGTERHGWDATMDRYKATYQSPGHEMGKLDFSATKVEMLGPDAAFVRGAWHLTMPDGKTPHGLFTLVFRKFPEGWKIVHDHTSAAEEQ